MLTVITMATTVKPKRATIIAIMVQPLDKAKVSWTKVIHLVFWELGQVPSSQAFIDLGVTLMYLLGMVVQT